jgi:hypothetical protein
MRIVVGRGLRPLAVVIAATINVVVIIDRFMDPSPGTDDKKTLPFGGPLPSEYRGKDEQTLDAHQTPRKQRRLYGIVINELLRKAAGNRVAWTIGPGRLRSPGCHLGRVDQVPSFAAATTYAIVKLKPLRPTQRRVTRNRNALPTTLTEDSDMAAAAMIGESRIPRLG